MSHLAVDLPVYAGPADATAVGNILFQAIASETVSDLAAGRRLVAERMSLKEYRPPVAASVGAARDRMRNLCDRTVGDHTE